MNKIHVLQFITPSGFYGAERWVIALANNSEYEQVVCDLAVTQEGGRPRFVSGRILSSGGRGSTLFANDWSP